MWSRSAAARHVAEQGCPSTSICPMRPPSSGCTVTVVVGIAERDGRRAVASLGDTAPMRALVQRVTRAEVTSRRVAGRRLGGVGLDRPWAVRAGRCDPRRHPAEADKLADKIHGTAHLRRRRRGDEPVGGRRRRSSPRRQPVHPLRRHRQGSAPELDRCGPTRGRRTARRAGRGVAARARLDGRDRPIPHRHAHRPRQRRPGHPHARGRIPPTR